MPVGGMPADPGHVLRGDPKTRKREVAALNHAMAALGLPEGTIVTRDEEETIPVDAGRIDVAPAWRFLLDVG